MDSVSWIMGDGVDKPFARMFYLAFIFALRTQSETLPALRETISDEMLVKSKPSPKSIVGIRDILGATRLVLKLSKRENDRRVSILAIPSFRKGYVLSPNKLRHVPVFWPIVRMRYQAWPPLFSPTRNKNMNRILKAALRTDPIPESDKYTTR